MPRTSGRRRESLNRARVVAAAVELADAEGLDAVSMRRLADRLGVVPMAIYKHVSDKEDLLDGMVDSVIEGFTYEELPAPVNWRAAMRAAVLGARHRVLAHPWARRAMETRTLRSVAVLRHMERLSRILLDAGFSPDLTHHSMHALGSRIWGFSPELFNDPGDERARTMRSDAEQPNPEDFPAILAIVADSNVRRPGGTCNEDFEFTFALDLLLDGIERRHTEGWHSTPR